LWNEKRGKKGWVCPTLMREDLSTAAGGRRSPWSIAERGSFQWGGGKAIIHEKEKIFPSNLLLRRKPYRFPTPLRKGGEGFPSSEGGEISKGAHHHSFLEGAFWKGQPVGVRYFDSPNVAEKGMSVSKGPFFSVSRGKKPRLLTTGKVSHGRVKKARFLWRGGGKKCLR